jgi:hypothetical protein
MIHAGFVTYWDTAIHRLHEKQPEHLKLVLTVPDIYIVTGRISWKLKIPLCKHLRIVGVTLHRNCMAFKYVRCYIGAVTNHVQLGSAMHICKYGSVLVKLDMEYTFYCIL